MQRQQNPSLIVRTRMVEIFVYGVGIYYGGGNGVMEA